MKRELPLFVYGTLMASGGQGHLLTGRRRRPGTVTGRLFHLRAGYPALLRGPQGIVHGQWLDPIPPPLLRMLDMYEGVEEGLYKREVVIVHTSTLQFEAWAWVMEEPERRGGVPIRSGRWRPIRTR